MRTSYPRLAPAFPAATEEQWRALADRPLGQAHLDAGFVSQTYDGLRIDPLYPKKEAATPIQRPPGPWRILQRVDHPDPEAANSLARQDLENGANGLVLVFNGTAGGRGFGLRSATPEVIEGALDGVMTDRISIRLDAGMFALRAGQALIEIVGRGNVAPNRLQLDLGIDPVGAWATGGRSTGNVRDAIGAAGRFVQARWSRAMAGSAMCADGRPYHEAGAAEAQEVACVVATGVAYLRALDEAGIELDAARRMLSFLLVADADEFLSVAKFRAIRRLWARVEDACGLVPRPIRLHAETAWRMATRRDPHVNILRSTVAAFSAVVGGADSLMVLPFTAALGLPDPFARRLARNTQLILLNEAHLSRVCDPAGGAGAFGALTDSLCGKAWQEFQSIEQAGGIVAALERKTVQHAIAAVQGRRDHDVRFGKIPITGTSEFANLDEAPVEVLLAAPPGSEFMASDSLLPSHRIAERFERLRDLSDAQFGATGIRPRMFLANLGRASAFTARSSFALSFFAASGIEASPNDGFISIEDIVSAARSSGANLACLCSSDELYAAAAGAAIRPGETFAEEVARVLRAAGFRHIALAGRPGDREAAYRRSGIDTFIFSGCDRLSLSERIFSELHEPRR